MRIEGVGIDIIEIARVKRALSRWGCKFESRILTSRELKVEKGLNHKAVFVAGRFAAKEAVFKSLEINPYWHKVNILKGKKGEPVVYLSSDVLKKAKKNIRRILISISHCKQYAVAQAIAVG